MKIVRALGALVATLLLFETWVYAGALGKFDPQLPEGIESEHAISEYTNAFGLFDVEEFFAEHGWDEGYHSSKDFYCSWQDKNGGPFLPESQVGLSCYEVGGVISGFHILFIGDCRGIVVTYNPDYKYKSVMTTKFGRVPEIIIRMMDLAFDAIEDEPYSLDEVFESLYGQIPGIKIEIRKYE